jgi:hypothetical protein
MLLLLPKFFRLQSLQISSEIYLINPNNFVLEENEYHLYSDNSGNWVGECSLSEIKY